MYVVEYSLKQKCFHVDSLSRAIKFNRQALLSRCDPSYRIIDTCETLEGANALACKWAKLLDGKGGKAC